jgi:repressor LexA
MTPAVQEIEMRGELPAQQLKVLNYIEEYIEISGYPPSIAEIAEFLGVSSTFGVRKHIDALMKKGFLTRSEAGLSRAIHVTRPSTAGAGGERKSNAIPIIGRVTAGQPILAVENVEGWLSFKPMDLSKTVFGLRVQGESMKDKGIMDGDLVIVRQQPTAEDGDIVVALLDDSATVKTFRKKGKGHNLQYELEPANEKFRPIPITEDIEFRILGKVTSVIRTLDEKRPGVFQLKFH